MAQSPPIRVAEIAANVRAEIARRDLRQTAIGDLLGLDQRAVSRRIRGTVAWSVYELEELARFLEVDLAHLIGERGEVSA